MKTFRQNFEEDYTAVKEPCDNKRGFKVRYVYVGLWYGWDIGRGELKRWKRRLPALCVAGICLLLMGGRNQFPAELRRPGADPRHARIGRRPIRGLRCRTVLRRWGAAGEARL